MGSDGAREATFHGKAAYPSENERWDGYWIFQAKYHDVHQIGPKEAQRCLLRDLRNELSLITEKYKHPCDNYILLTNVSLTPVFQKGIKDKIDNEIVSKYTHKIKHIHVWGAEEICRFLDAYPKVRQAYAHLLVSGDIIARLLGMIEGKEADLDELVKLYCQGCFTHEQYAALDDAGDVEDRRVELQRIFIDIDVKPSTLYNSPRMSKRLPKWLKQASEDDKRVSALSYLLDDSARGLVLVGGPGEGKSTLVQYVAQIHRARIIGKAGELFENTEEFEKCMHRIPFIILLREYAQWVASRRNSDSIFHYLATLISRESGKTVNSEDIHSIVKANSILLILDGLDEVSEKKLRERVLNNITSFAYQARDILNGDLRIIATTRPYGYSEEFDPAHYLHVNIQKLSPEKVLLYARQWKDVREPRPKEAERVLSTLSVCLKDKVVSVLTQTPLQVTILLVIIRARGTPPKQREELFERYMDVIYQREQKNRPELLRTEKDVIYGLHKYLAYILHKRAEKDRTAALMNISEFRERVERYLVHSNPLLEEEELIVKIDQIIREASQRLVLIESPQEGKIGFGLTTMREYFAASHLVDTAQDTKERDSRFRAIAKSPHWRNVTLFFAGRVGRTRPGEAPSIVDVCRQIDTERVDKHVRRGAELVMEIVDDRALREPHNEIGAIQFSLKMLERIGTIDSKTIIEKLESLSDVYREKVIRPYIEERLKTATTENLVLYGDVYLGLFGLGKSFLAAIKRASEFDSRRVRLWALSAAIASGVVEKWVVELFEDLISDTSGDLLSIIRQQWSHMRYYFIFPLSAAARKLIVEAFVMRFEEALLDEETKPLDRLMVELSEIEPNREPKENFLYFWTVSQLLTNSLIPARIIARQLRRHAQTVSVYFPAIVFPSLRRLIKKKASLFRNFCEAFSEESEPFTRLLVELVTFLLNPHDSQKYIKIHETAKNVQWHSIVQPIIGLRKRTHEELREDHKSIYALYQYYNSKENIVKDEEELTELANKESSQVRSHPYKLIVWMNSDCDQTIERFLDGEIIRELKMWLQRRGLPENTFSLCFTSVDGREPGLSTITSDILEITAHQLENGRKVSIQVLMELCFDLLTRGSRESVRIRKQLRRAFEAILTNYTLIIDLRDHYWEMLYWLCLGHRIVEERHMVELYEIFHEERKYKHFWWFARMASKAKPFLSKMLKSGNAKVTRLAAVSLAAIHQERQFASLFGPKKISESWIADKLWELADNKKDIWRPKYIEGLACCTFNWEQRREEMLRAIKETRTDELRDAWRSMIESAGYTEDKDGRALFRLLLHILESKNIFADSIRYSAGNRLHRIVSEIEPAEFDQEELNLPLSRRAKIRLP